MDQAKALFLKRWKAQWSNLCIFGSVIACIAFGIVASAWLGVSTAKLFQSQAIFSALWVVGFLVCGFFGSLWLALGLSPHFVQLGFQAKKTNKTLHDYLPIHQKAKKIAIYEINDDDFVHFGKNVVVAGLFYPLLGFYPKIFASQTVVNSCSKEEWSAILAHEWGHIECHHLKKRILSGFTTFTAATFFTVCILVGMQMSGYRNVHTLIILCSGLVPSVITWFHLQKTLIQQEIEADDFAQKVKPVSSIDLVSALKKLSALNEYNVQPIVQERIKRLEQKKAA